MFCDPGSFSVVTWNGVPAVPLLVAVLPKPPVVDAPNADVVPEPNPPVVLPPPNRLVDPVLVVVPEPNAGLFPPKSPPPVLPLPNVEEVLLDVDPKPPKVVPDVDPPPKRPPPVVLPKGLEPKLVVVLLVPKPPRRESQHHVNYSQAATIKIQR